MALKDIELAKIQVDYQAGKLSKSGIAQKHHISRNTLAKHAKDGKWEYGKNEQELSSIIQEKVYEKLVDVEVDRATKITNDFLKDFNDQRTLLHKTTKAFERLIKDKENILTKEDSDMLQARAKAHKILMEGYNIGYLASRKAMGMDKDDDVEKARKIKYGETDSSSGNKLQERIKEKMKANGFDD